MKIALYATHYGLRNMMLDLLEDHEVEVYNNSVYFENNIKAPKDDQLIISTFPYKELEYLPENRKVIIYATDPFPLPALFFELQEKPNVVVVGDVDGVNVYPKVRFPIKPKYSVQHTIKDSKMPKYKGTKNSIAVCTRKISRWQLINDRELEEFLADIPYDIKHIPDDKRFFEEVSEYKAVFHFAHSPYTLSMFEFMAMHMPVVIYGNCAYSPVVYKKYFDKVSSESSQVREWLKDLLNKNEPQFYPQNKVFNDAKTEWNKIIENESK